MQAEVVQCGEVGLNDAAVLGSQGLRVAPELGREALNIKIKTQQIYSAVFKFQNDLDQ